MYFKISLRDGVAQGENRDSPLGLQARIHFARSNIIKRYTASTSHFEVEAVYTHHHWSSSKTQTRLLQYALKFKRASSKKISTCGSF